MAFIYTSKSKINISTRFVNKKDTCIEIRILSPFVDPLVHSNWKLSETHLYSDPETMDFTFGIPLKPSFDLCLTICAKNWFIHSQGPRSLGQKITAREVCGLNHFHLNFVRAIFVFDTNSRTPKNNFCAEKYVSSKNVAREKMSMSWLLPLLVPRPQMNAIV